MRRLLEPPGVGLRRAGLDPQVAGSVETKNPFARKVGEKLELTREECKATIRLRRAVHFLVPLFVSVWTALLRIRCRSLTGIAPTPSCAGPTCGGRMKGYRAVTGLCLSSRCSTDAAYSSFEAVPDTGSCPELSIVFRQSWQGKQSSSTRVLAVPSLIHFLALASSTVPSQRRSLLYT